MSGHSKWKTIKAKKGKEDQRRASVFTKLARYITVAVKEGGSNPEFNPSLKSAIEKAKAENMPNDNIERAIKKGEGGEGDANYENVTYEGYGIGGVAVIVECLTDNRNRTASDVRHAFDKHGGNLGTTGCVSYLFDKKGFIAIENDGSVDEDTLTMDAIDLGAEDFKAYEEGYEIYTSVEDFNQVVEGLKDRGYKLSDFDISNIPQTTVKLDEEQAIKFEKMVDDLEESDDVQSVSHNLED
ncbi:YebC/PmpR family DNA-binding transcriptional regulator [Fenollaria timonensis]|jgi:YebC/PmpR family DNA-binding regulatory protein|uniref:YebC/PmpR family DNA-binding transcriptional regulator n=1 Tax=Fenollaria timonensis TaxID=1723384 RepID=UPI00071C73DE|nr:YebC/PmpR family DNA-binding transcriptional regulator [Fenollaria timonensis]